MGNLFSRFTCNSISKVRSFCAYKESEIDTEVEFPSPKRTPRYRWSKGEDTTIRTKFENFIQKGRPYPSRSEISEFFQQHSSILSQHADSEKKLKLRSKLNNMIKEYCRKKNIAKKITKL